jgi:hypothetical protein
MPFFLHKELAEIIRHGNASKSYFGREIAIYSPMAMSWE